MQLFENLDKDNFILYAAKHYYSPRCIDAEEFYDDLSRFKYIKRLVNRHQRGGDLGEKLLLNHLTIILNVFGHEAGLKMLEYKIGIDNFDVIKPFLVYMKAITFDQYTDIQMDQAVVDKLRTI
jgi:hypothetical protein